MGVLSTGDFCEGGPSASLSCHQIVKMPPLQKLGWGRRWEQNLEVQQPNPSLSKFIHLRGRVPPCSLRTLVFLCLCKCLPCSLLSQSFLPSLFTCQNTTTSSKPIANAVSSMWLFPMSQPDVFSASSEPHSGLCLSFDIIFSRVLPSLLSWDAHSEGIGLNDP